MESSTATLTEALELEDILDPSLYLGIATSTEGGQTGLRPLRCQEQ